MDQFTYVIEDRTEAESVLHGLRMVATDYFRQSAIAVPNSLARYYYEQGKEVDRYITRLEEALDPTPEPPETSRDEDLVPA